MIVASTRVIVGAHYVSDIFAGTLVAYITTIFLRDKFFQRSKLFQNKDGVLSVNENVQMIFEYFEKKLISLFFSLFRF